jgi:flagellar M-ring protein FliF
MAESRESPIQQLVRVVRSIPPARLVTFGAILSIVIGGFVALFLFTNRPDYQVLFSNLDPSDASRIMEKLKEKRIPFQIREGGRAIFVPEENVYELRLGMASEGLPQGRNVGFEALDQMPFGTTEFIQKLKVQQALQGELARTIMGFDAVSQARVHIVPASESLFVGPDQSRSTASIVIRTKSGRSLDRRQLQGIIHLVACAVEGLKPENVTVVDMEGGLLAKGGEADGIGALSGSQYDYKRKVEQTLERMVQTMLEPIVGANKVVTRVTAEVDFRQVNIAEERYEPDSGVIRSEQRQKETASGGKDLPAGSPDLKFEVYESQGTMSGTSKSFQKENSVTNYEINRINKQIVSALGEVKRLSAAVVIDGPYVAEKDAAGKAVQKFVPRSRKEMKGFEEIVKKAIGFDEARGDQVTVSNVPFAITEEVKEVSETESVWMAYLKKGVRPMFNVLVIALFVFLVVRPFRKWLTQAGEAVKTQALQGGPEYPKLEAGGAGGGEAAVGALSKANILEISKTDPEKIAEIIRGWVREGS